MRTVIITLTKNGAFLGEKLKAKIDADIYHREGFVSLSELIRDIYGKYDTYILIMATGIAMRMFAPYIRKKTVDPALLVLDEKGKFIISLLSGHLGGANAAAVRIGALIGATPVITTATDVNGKIAMDIVAKRNDLLIENVENLKFISAAVVNGEKVELLSTLKIREKLPPYILSYGGGKPKNLVVLSSRIFDIESKHSLIMRPLQLILGIGVRKGIPYAEISRAFEDFMTANHLSPLSIRKIASIDLKAEEEGILELSRVLKRPFVCFTGEELKKMETPSSSDFVQKVTGVHSVCESAALKAAVHGRLLVKKTIYPGITFSIAEEEKEIFLYE